MGMEFRTSMTGIASAGFGKIGVRRAVHDRYRVSNKTEECCASF